MNGQIPEGYRLCKRCGNVKPEERFNSTHKWCLDCRRVYQDQRQVRSRSQMSTQRRSKGCATCSGPSKGRPYKSTR